ncbi:hypothetical protein ACM1RC_14675 [Paenibacillus azoreducens]|uniref:hypothetical protein n=1 Tax=Paenibacillus azoreducens TaxID=116718 RepID=UPI0039F5D48F
MQKNACNLCKCRQQNGAEGEIRWEALLPLVKKTGERTNSWESYFDEKELRILKEKLPRLESSDELTQSWVRVIARIEHCLKAGLPPDSSEGQAIASEIERLSELTFGENKDLMNKFWELRKNPDSTNQGLVPLRLEVLQFVEECLSSV